MLSRNNMLLNLYEENADKGNPAPDTSQANKTEDKGKTYTQAELDAELSRVGAKEKREAKATTEKALLERLKATSFEELESLIEAKRKADESAKSETEKMQELLAQKDREIAEAKAEALKAESLRRIEKRNSGIRALVQDAHDVDGVLVILESKFQASIEALMNDAGEFDDKEALKLITEFRAKNAYLFKGQGKGSPSNADGRLLKPDEEVRKQAAKEMGGKFRI
jgi:predicted component of type VI protein secretion system